MTRKTELLLVTALLVLAALLRLADLTHLPPGFSRDELAYIRITEAMRAGEVSVYYQVGDHLTRAALFGGLNAFTSNLAGDGLLGYRMLPIWSGLITLALLYALGRRLFGVPVALIALAAMSANLRAVLLARTVTAESLIPAYTLLVLLCLAVAFNLRRAVAFRVPHTLPFALLAILAGGSGYLHYLALVFGPLAFFFFLHLWRTDQPLARRMWSMWVFVVVLATIVALPYLASTLRDPRLSEPYMLWRDRPASIGEAGEGLLNAVGGLLWMGDRRVSANAGGHALLGPLLALLLVIGTAQAIRRWRDPRHALLLLSLAAGLLTDAWIGPGATFTANLVALPAVFLLVGVGGQAVWRELHGRGIARAWRPVAALLLVSLLANTLVVRDRLYHDWKNSPAVRAAYHGDLAALAAYLDRTPGDLPVSLCITGMNVPGEAGLSPRQILTLMRHRTSEPVRHSDCRAGMVLINAGAPMRFIFADPEDRKTMPPELADWLAGAGPVAAEGMPAGAVLRVDVEQRLRDAGGQWDLFAPVYFMPEADEQPVQARLPVPLEQGLTFAGYDPGVFKTDRLAGGDPIVLVTYWRVDEPLPADLGLYAHLLGYTQTASPVLQIEPWAEANSIDVQPDELAPRDFFIQVLYIWLRENLKPDRYALTVGAFRDEVAVLENHLSVLDAAQQYAPHGDRLLLGHVNVVES